MDFRLPPFGGPAQHCTWVVGDDTGYATCGISTVRQLALITEGIFHEPSRIEGLFSFGQYRRSISWNLPAGAGSQFDSLSGPGESFWM